MPTTPLAELPQDLIFRQEWQMIVFDQDGNRVEKLGSGWYQAIEIPQSMLNHEYPEATETGFRFMLQTRWISEHRPVKVESNGGGPQWA